MAVVRAMVSMERDSLLPEDRVVNTLHFRLQTNAGDEVGDFVTPAEATTLVDSLNTAWAARMASLFGVTLEGRLTIQVYDMADAEPRVPVAEGTSLANSVGTTALPSELAVCLSFEGAPASGVNQARRRGRIFLGPLPETAMAAPANGERRVASNYRTAALGLYQDIDFLAATTGNQWRLGVLSRRAMSLGQTASQAFTETTRAWVDDAFDIQRRRGAASVSRSEYIQP